MEREKSIDILKGIGIILVIVGHIQEYIPKNFLIYLYSFHMPLFFYISGYLYKERYENLNTKDYIKKRAKQLVYPYITLLVISFLWLIIENYNIISIIKFILSFIYSNYIFETNYVGAVWFLLCLFNVEIIYFFIRKSKVRKYTGLIIIIIFCIGVIFSKLAIFRLPFWLDIVPFGILFYHLGHLIKKNKKVQYSLLVKIILTVLFICISIITIVLNFDYCYNDKFLGRIDMLYLHFGNYIYFIIGAMAGIFTWQIIAEIIKQNNILEWIGRNTLLIMGTHLIILSKLTSIKNNTLLLGILSKINIYEKSILLFVLLFILTLILSFIEIIFINRLLPWIVNYNELQKMIERKKNNERI